jgi:hypothetical protein
LNCAGARQGAAGELLLVLLLLLLACPQVQMLCEVLQREWGTL